MFGGEVRIHFPIMPMLSRIFATWLAAANFLHRLVIVYADGDLGAGRIALGLRAFQFQ